MIRTSKKMYSSDDLEKNHLVECEISGSEISVPEKQTVSVQLEESMRVYSLWNPCECASREMI